VYLLNSKMLQLILSIFCLLDYVMCRHSLEANGLWLCVQAGFCKLKLFFAV
jgi:hypothetical protein